MGVAGLYDNKIISKKHAERLLGLANWSIGCVRDTGSCYYPEESSFFNTSPIPKVCQYCGMKLEDSRCIACGAPQNEWHF